MADDVCGPCRVQDRVVAGHDRDLQPGMTEPGAADPARKLGGGIGRRDAGQHASDELHLPVELFGVALHEVILRRVLEQHSRHQQNTGDGSREQRLTRAVSDTDAFIARAPAARSPCRAPSGSV